jgi:predicted nucleic acid-binding protein
MAITPIGYRDRALLPRLGSAVPRGPVLLDSNVFINALAGRGTPALQTLLANLTNCFVSGPVLLELRWPRGRLDPGHPDTASILSKFDAVIARLSPQKILVPDAAQWGEAGELAGTATRAIAGAQRRLTTAERIELMNDAVTAVVASAAGATIITQDADFDLFCQLDSRLDVLFYS